MFSGLHGYSLLVHNHGVDSGEGVADGDHPVVLLATFGRNPVSRTINCGFRGTVQVYELRVGGAGPETLEKIGICSFCRHDKVFEFWNVNLAKVRGQEL